MNRWKMFISFSKYSRLYASNEVSNMFICVIFAEILMEEIRSLYVPFYLTTHIFGVISRKKEIRNYQNNDLFFVSQERNFMNLGN